MTLHQAAGLRPRPRSVSGRGASRSKSTGDPHAIPSGSAHPRTRSLAIVSGKGGVGKSTLAVNLALCLAERERGALLIDCDLGLANADLLLGLVPKASLAEWCEGAVDFEDVLTAGPCGLDLIVSGSSRNAARALVSSAAGQGTGRLVREIRSRTTTVFDLGAGIGASVLEVATACDLVWLVVEPEPTSLADAYTMARRLFERDPDLRIEVVVNRAADAAEADRTHSALARLVRRFLDRDLPLRGVLLEDARMRRAVVEQRPLVLESNATGAGRRIALLADSLAEEALAEPAPAHAVLPA